MLLTAAESQKLSSIRAIALSLVIATHVFQEYGMYFGSLIASIGVQLFLILSGFLLGQKDVTAWIPWFKRRFVRLIPPYYLLIVLTVVAYQFVLKENIVDKSLIVHFSMLHYLFFDFSSWGGHLWFITVIVLCYFICPFLQGLYKTKRGFFMIITFLLVPLAMVAVQFFGYDQMRDKIRILSAMYSFILGFAFAKLFCAKIPKYFRYLFVFILLFLMMMLGLMKLSHIGTNGIKKLSHIVLLWNRCIGGFTVFLIMYSFEFLGVFKLKMISFLDRYSYEIYLSHYMFILGPLSLLHLSRITVLNIFIAITSGLLLAFVLKKTVEMSARQQARFFCRNK